MQLYITPKNGYFTPFLLKKLYYVCNSMAENGIFDSCSHKTDIKTVSLVEIEQLAQNRIDNVYLILRNTDTIPVNC